MVSCSSLLSFALSLDIQFWRSRKTLEGLSVRSVFFNVFQSVIVLLYVMDNETNTVIIISCFIGLLIEIWKINKAVNIKVSLAIIIYKLFKFNLGQLCKFDFRQF